MKREIKSNLLLDVFGERFDELETDWTEMSKQKFLSEAQKCKYNNNKNKMRSLILRKGRPQMRIVRLI